MPGQYRTDMDVGPRVVSDGTADRVDDQALRWKVQQGRTYAIAVAAVAVTAAAFLPGRDLAVLLTGLLICLLSVFVTWWSAPLNTRLTQLAIAGGALWAWRTTHLAADGLVVPDGVPGEIIRHSYGVWAATLLLVIILIGTPLALPFLTGLGITALIVTPVSVALLLEIPVTQLLAVTTVVVIFEIGVLPRVLLSVCGLLGLDRVRIGEPAEQTDVGVVVGRVDAMLVGAAIALAALGALAAATLTIFGGTRWTYLLGVTVGIVLLTRSRVFDQARHVAPFRIAGTICLVVAGAVGLYASASLWPWLPAISVVAALLYVAGAVIPRSALVNIWAARTMHVIEVILVVVALALTAQVLGLYELVG